MSMFRRSIKRILACLLALAVPLGPQASGAATKILTIRPDRLSGQTTAQPGQAPRRDPFNWSRSQINEFKDKAPRAKSNSIEGLTLTGIIWDKNKPLAVVNDRVVGKGDIVNDSVILEVMKDIVVFEKDSIYHTLWLEPSVINLTPVKKRR